MIDATQARLAGLMAVEGLPFRPAARIPNTRPAQECAAWGMAAGHPQIGNALHRAHFADGKDIGDPATLVALAATVGLDADRAEEVLRTRSQRAQIDADWHRARRLGVTG